MTESTLPFPTSETQFGATPASASSGGRDSASSAATRPDASAQTTTRPAADLGAAAASAATAAGSAVDRVVQTGQEHLGRVGTDLKVNVERVVGSSEEWVETVRCSVRENPLGAMAVAVAAGLLLARLSR